jgi:hypothetical protein
MPGPFTNPTQQAKTTEYGGHLRYDGVGLNPLAAGFAEGNASDGAGGFMENRQGHRSGVTSSTPWVSGSWGPAGAGRPTISPYGDSNASGAGTTYAAATLTDSGKLWGVGDADVGASVTYGANTVTDSARNNANAWVVGNTAQYAGLVIVTATGKIGTIASAAAGVLTLNQNWIGGTPAAGEAYRIAPNNGFVGRQITSVAAGAKTTAVILYHINTVATFTAWSNGTPANGTPYIIEPVDIAGSHAIPPPAGPWVNGAFVPRGGGEKSDNAYKALSEESNTEVV